jgi:hypothetical protein
MSLHTARSMTVNKLKKKYSKLKTEQENMDKIGNFWKTKTLFQESHCSYNLPLFMTCHN